MPAIAPIAPHQSHASTLRQLLVLERALALLSAADLRHPAAQAVLARLGGGPHLFGLMLASRLAHHEAGLRRKAAAAALNDTYPAASAAFAEPL